MFETLLSGHASYDTQKNWISLAKEKKIKKWNYLVYKEADLDKKKGKRVINISWKWNRFFCGKLKRKKRKIFKKYSDKCQRIWTDDRDIEAKNVNKSQRFGRYEERETQHIQNKMLKKDTEKFYRILGTKNIEAWDPFSKAE